MLRRCYHSQRATRGTLLASLKECSSSKDVERGSQLHSAAVESGHDSDMHVATAVVDMYANCGRLGDARKVFAGMPRRDVVSWNALILGCVENGESELALELFYRMDCSPTARTYVAVLKAHAVLVSKEPWSEVEDGKLVKVNSLKQGMTIYSQAEAQTNVFVATAMVDLCTKCGSMPHARRVFEGIRRPDVGLWNALILGYAENDENEVALELFSRMRLVPNTRSFVAVFKACTNLAALEEARAVDGRLLKVNTLHRGISLHALAAKHGFESDTFVGNSLLDMYANCGDMVESHRVFDKTQHRTVVSWTALMAGYVDTGDASMALEIFSRMRSEAFEPDDRAISAALLACVSLARNEAGRSVGGVLIKLKSLKLAMELHSQLSDCGGDIQAATTLLDVYASCGSMVDAGRVFHGMINHDIVTWNSFMAGYVENDEPDVALELFQCMKAGERGCVPNALTFTVVLGAIAALARQDQASTLIAADGKRVKTKWLDKGMEVHREAEIQKLSSELLVGGSLVDMYMACGSISDACEVFFLCLPVHSVHLWSKMILGCVDNGEPRLALDEFYYRMRVAEEELTPTALTLAALLKACASAADLRSGKALHRDICRCGFSESDDPVLESALIDMHGKCGSVVNAQRVFDSWRTGMKDSVCWSSLMSGYSKSGDCSRVLESLNQMVEEGVEVQGSTLVSVLSACSHAGLAETCKRVFNSMESRFRVHPGVEHYNCMLDMLGRGNRLDEAVELATGMGELADAQSWRIVLAAARTWTNQRVGEKAFHRLLRLQPHHTDAASFVLMANIYASSAADAA